MNPVIRADAFSITLPLLSSVLLVFSATLAADDLATELDEIVVTATRTAQTVDDTLASVTILTAEDIKKQQASSLQELLQARAGFQLVNNGGAGKITSLFLRGTESDHVLVLIDGIKINSSSTGTPPLELIPLEMIERIEIVRGAKSSLYGSEAIGGVIQIFTKKGRAGTPAKPSVSLYAGSHDTQGISAGIRGGTTKGWYSLNLKRESSDGYNACTGSSTLFAGCFTEEADNDGFDNASISLSTGLQLTNKTLLTTQFLRSDNEVEFDGAPPFSPNESESLIQSYGLTITSELTDRVDIRFSAGHSDNRNKNFQSGTFFSLFNGERDSYSLQSNIDISHSQLLTLGIDYQNDEAETTAYTATSRDNNGVFAAYQADIETNHVNLSLRYDDNDQFGNKTTGNFAIGRPINSHLKWLASYATAFKAPTFNELLFPFFGNPDLQPEDSESVELGLRGKQTWGSWSSTLYRTDVDDLIVFDAALNLANNVSKAEIKGFEFIANTRIKNWHVSTHLTWLDTKDKSAGNNNGNELARRPDKSLRLNMERDFGKFNLGSSLVAEGNRFDDTGNTRRINGYASVDLRAAYRINKALSVQVKVANLFDKAYETTSFFPQDDRNYILTFRYTPE